MSLSLLYHKYKDILAYGFWGVMTTLVNIGSYFLVSRLLFDDVTISTVIAWGLSVLFAYATNRKWVFHSQACGRREVLKEISSFITCRLFTGLIDWSIMFVFVECIHFPDIVVKVVANIVVIVLNYVASKLVIFKH